MQTLREYLVKRLECMGMFSDDADVVATKTLASMNSNVPGYDMERYVVDGDDDPILTMSMLYARKEGLKYIDEHCPMAWFRPMFDQAQLDQILEEEKQKANLSSRLEGK